MLRDASGYVLANKRHDTRSVQDWLGHRSITSTAVYTALANRFKDFWRDGFSRIANKFQNTIVFSRKVTMYGLYLKRCFSSILKELPVATKERLMAMAAAHCAVCSGAMVLTLVETDPTL
jgi:hypothetical protein